jgi:magnesium transporter
MRSVAAVRADIERGCRGIDKGAVWVAHSLLDHLTDHYFPVMDSFDDAVDALEIEVVTHPTREALQRIFALKRSLMRLRRVAVHQKEILMRLSRGEFALIPERALPFYRDVYDHFVRVSDLADTYRELVSGALDAYLSTQSNRMNEIMKVLTGFSTVMLPLTFIAGVYGMNFEHMPELKWEYGYAFAWALMLVVAAGLLVYFRRKRWF